MALFRIYLMSVRQHAAVNIHAWDMAGDIRDARGAEVSPGMFEFPLDMSAPDLSGVSFKFWYPQESPLWESEDYVRRVPSPAPAAVWATEFSGRCLTTDPRAIPTLPEGTEVTVGALTAHRFAGGKLYVWNAASGESRLLAEADRDDARKLSFFRVRLEPWMTSGFHFKLVDAQGRYEPEGSNRFWRPVDGTTVFIKSGQVVVSPTAPMPVGMSISVIVPSALAANAALGISDAVDDFAGDAEPTGVVPLDEEFIAVGFRVSLYPNAAYDAVPRIEGADGVPGYRPQWSLPLRVPAGVPPAEKHTLLGVSEWYDTRPTRDAVVDLHIHANPASTFGDAVDVAWHLGFARRTRDETPAPVAAKAVARAAGPGLWIATLKLFNGVPHWLDAFASGSAIESRADGPSLSQRDIRPGGPGPTVLHTIDGQTGISAAAPAAAVFAEVTGAERAQLMQAAFSVPIVAAGVFEPHEMPHGATWHSERLWFVLPAPHAIRASLLLLDRARSTAAGRVVRATAMTLTPDLRYWWCNLAREDLPDPARVEYRFAINDVIEVLDPASREVSSAEYVWTEPGEGPDAAWSIAVDRNKLAEIAKAIGWQTPFWNEFMIYELHARRFTDRNDGAAPLVQVEKELGRYFASLPVTALELLPINEFPKYISWGYNSSLYFAIESSYGGAEAFASLVRSAHAAGKAIVLDLVYNHLTDAPMQAIARDVFADGETQWGDMVNYDHPACLEYFRQALLYLFDTFAIDGVRLDATEAIVNGDKPNPYIIRDGRTGSGGGWQFLLALQGALDRAAAACGRRLPYVVAENNPDNWGMDGIVVDGQWDFDFLDRLGRAATVGGDAASELADELMTFRAVAEPVRPSDTHDSCSGQDPNAQRIAARGPWGTGMRMAKACGALALLAKGVPMFFMGAEAGETKPFFFDVPASGDRLPLDAYDHATSENGRVLAWYRALLGLRKNWANGFASADTPYIGKGHRTVAFTRDGGHFFVVVTLGTDDRRQDLGWLGLPQGSAYKEVFNSTWPPYKVDWDDAPDNGGYGARLTAASLVNLPQIGAVVLERV